jgi:hypothetical protein
MRSTTTGLEERRGFFANIFGRWFSGKESDRVRRSAGAIMFIALLVSIYSFKKIYTSYLLIFPGLDIDAILYTASLILAEITGFVLVSKIHLLKKYNRIWDFRLSWFAIVVVLLFEVLCNIISHYAGILSGSMNGIEAFQSIFGVSIQTAMVILAWIMGSLPPLLGGLFWKISTGLNQAMDLAAPQESEKIPTVSIPTVWVEPSVEELPNKTSSVVYTVGGEQHAVSKDNDTSGEPGRNDEVRGDAGIGAEKNSEENRGGSAEPDSF